MRNKRYTNVTFTKRVDHESGASRRTRDAGEQTTCKTCHAVYLKRRWVSRENLTDEARRLSWQPRHLTICPACRRKSDGVPSGFVNVEGKFFAAHREEIEALLRNEADRAAADNPLARIMEWKEARANHLTITTTTEHLAQRLGHALEKAFDGDVRYDFSHENKVARVTWQRD